MGTNVILSYVFFIVATSMSSGRIIVDPVKVVGLQSPYFVTVPRKLFAGTYSTVVISINELHKDANISLKLFSLNKEANSVAKIILAKKGTDSTMDRISFYVPTNIESPCNLKIQSKGGVNFEHSVDLEVETVKDTILIQTDKPIYKPGGTLKARVIVIDGNLKPKQQNIDEIFVTNPTGSRIMQWTNSSTHNGMLALEMPISVKPVLGKWKITVNSKESIQKQSFMINKYVLPKFKVMITSPSYILRTEKVITFKICSHYTYGKKVAGKLKINMCAYPKKSSTCETVERKITGCEDIDYKLVSDRLLYSRFRAEATVTEDGSGVVISANHTTQTLQDNDVRLTIKVPKYYKPHFDFNVSVLLTRPDGRPILEDTRIEFSIGKTSTSSLQYKNVLKKTIVVSNGVYKTFVSPPSNNKRYKFKASYKYKAYTLSAERHLVDRQEVAHVVSNAWFSPTEKFIQISSVHNLVVGKFAKIHVRFSKTLQYERKYLNYLVVCKGNIRVAKATVSTAEPSAYIQFRVDREMLPKCRILVYCISNNEFISDNKVVTLAVSFQNKVSLSFSSGQKKPSDNVELVMKAHPGSLFAVSAVDKSVLLLGTSNDIKEEQLLSVLEEQDVTPGSAGKREKCDRRFGWGGHYNHAAEKRVDSRLSIKNTGLRYFTNAKVDVVPCPPITYPRIYSGVNRRWFSDVIEESISPGPMPMRRLMKLDSRLKLKLQNIRKKIVKNFEKKMEKKKQAVNKIRTEFPETWLWTEEVIGSSGETKMSVKLPDTITTWSVHGFALSQSHGMGVATSTNIRAFQPFFVSLSLPYSVKRGETIKIPTTVFNYLDDCLVVGITLKQSTNFIAVSELSTKLCVCGGFSKAFKFSVKPVILGEMDISVTANSLPMDTTICDSNAIVADVTAGDALTKKLLVEAEGIKKEYSTSVFSCPSQTANTHTLSLNLPKSIVPGSVYAQLAVTGDILGPSMQGVDKLLAMPFGCGEQNMLNFAPNIYIMDYLTATKQVTPQIESKSKQFMRSGYQRELTYKHRDGAYSAFGESDKQGSTWLTAFVLRTYAQASRYIFIDPEEINASKNWLFGLQKQSGCFKEVGMVHHKEMKGGVTSGITMTAFVLIALLEAGASDQDYRIRKARTCIESQLDDVKDYYTAAVLAFTLRYVDSPKVDKMLQMLKKGEIKDEGIHWEDKVKTKKTPSNTWWNHQARSADIETTAYALMAYSGGRKPFGSGLDHLSIVKWLVKQRNSYGGFSSTQDTCVALQALSQFSASTFSDSTGLTIQAKYSSQQKTIVVNAVNKLVLQKHQIDALLPLDVEIKAEGKGCALIQADVKYNEPKPGDESAFNVHVTVKQDNNSLTCSHKMKVCASYQGEGKSNMGLIDIAMVSGFEPVVHELDIAIQSGNVPYAQYEFLDGVLSFYFEEFGQQSTCAEFSIEQVAEVDERKPASLTVYDYYDKENSATTMYVTAKCPEVNVVS